MEEKPQVLILGANSKKGKHAFNFDKYMVRFNYQFSNDGIIIELFPPMKKKQVDYKYFVSPYGEEVNLKNVRYQNIEKQRKKDKENMRRTKKPKEENKEKWEKPEMPVKVQKKKNALKKCVIQEVFNFSEMPDAINKFFPYESYSQESQESLPKNFKNRILKDTKNKVACKRPSSSPEMRMSRSSDIGVYIKNRRPVKDVYSGIQFHPEHSEHTYVRNESSVAILRKRLDKLERENQTLQRKLGCVYQPFL